MKLPNEYRWIMSSYRSVTVNGYVYQFQANHTLIRLNKDFGLTTVKQTLKIKQQHHHCCTNKPASKLLWSISTELTHSASCSWMELPCSQSHVKLRRFLIQFILAKQLI